MAVEDVAQLGATVAAMNSRPLLDTFIRLQQSLIAQVALRPQREHYAVHRRLGPQPSSVRRSLVPALKHVSWIRRILAEMP